MSKRSKWGARGLALVGALSLGLGATVGCTDDDDTSTGKRGGGAGTAAGGAGMGGEASKRGGAGTGGEARGGEAGAGEAGAGGAGGATQCDCSVTIPLSCACAAGLCTTFADDLQAYRAPARFGLPYYVLLGTCASGYHTLSFGEATEQSGTRTYDAKGNMVYDEFTGYGGVVPDACGLDTHYGLGRVTIGEDPAKSCSYCLFAGDDPRRAKEAGAGGAGGAAGTGGAAGAGDPWYPESSTPPCDPSVYD